MWVYWFYNNTWGSLTAEATDVLTTRLSLVGASQQRLSLVGASQQRVSLVGTSQERVTLTGSSE